MTWDNIVKPIATLDNVSESVRLPGIFKHAISLESRMISLKLM